MVKELGLRQKQKRIIVKLIEDGTFDKHFAPVLSEKVKGGSVVIFLDVNVGCFYDQCYFMRISYACTLALHSA